MNNFTKVNKSRELVFSLLLFFPLLFGLDFTNSTAHEILIPEGSEVETFEAWCDEPKNDCVIKIRYGSNYFKAKFQVDHGIPITKDQFLEIIPLSKPFGWNKYYSYKILYKDENTKVGSAQIIFTNKQRSLEFGQALKRFGTE